jgi:hypothetical protein|tara:strand:- start:4084 stop:4407 length:324 start_codon:yes stop_codon:yes gene_type:complete
MVVYNNTMSDEWIRDYYGYGRLWDSIFNGTTPRTQVKAPTMGATLRQLIEQLESMAQEMEKKDDFEADITLRFNGKIYSIEIKQIAELEPDSENNSNLPDDDSNNSA